MRPNARTIVVLVVLAILAVVPAISAWTDVPFWTDLARRMMILAIAALSLNLLMGFGGMISFGHAAYIGVGAYAVGICAFYDVTDGWVQLAIALAGSAALALVFGAISLRTRGVYFIMITLALAQMMYYLAAGLDAYGGDDGLPINQSSDFGVIDFGSSVPFYYVTFVLLVLALLFMHRLVNSRFGMVLQGIRSNEARMQALGHPTLRYRLVAFVIAGMMAGLAGVLLANHTNFANPEMMHWTRSGDLIVMVLLGGMGTVAGPVVGTVVYLALEEFLAGFTEHWQLIIGPFLVLVVLFARGGLLGFLAGGSRRDG